MLTSTWQIMCQNNLSWSATGCLVWRRINWLYNIRTHRSLQAPDTALFKYNHITFAFVFAKWHNLGNFTTARLEQHRFRWWPDETFKTYKSEYVIWNIFIDIFSYFYVSNKSQIHLLSTIRFILHFFGFWNPDFSSRIFQ